MGRDIRESDGLHVLIIFCAVAHFCIEDRFGLNCFDNLQDFITGFGGIGDADTSIARHVIQLEAVQV